MKKSLPIFILTLALFGCTKTNTLDNIESQISGSNQQDLTLNQEEPMTQTQPEPTPVASEEAKPNQKQQAPAATQATINTSKGVVIISLKPDLAPLTVENFSQKANTDFYKGLTFHRVEDWVVQGGDPLGTGTGGGKMPTELSEGQFSEGSVGVARGGDINVSNDSQFFICTTDCTWLNGKYTYFGQVTSGLNVVKNIQVGDKILDISVK